MDELITIIEKFGLPFAYDHFAEGESPNPPFVVCTIPRSNNFFADGVVYYSISTVNIELYTETKNPGLEATIESVLKNHWIKWEKSEAYIPEESLYEVIYEFEKEL